MDIDLTLREINLGDFDVDFDRLTEGYFYVKLSNLFPETCAPCDIYFPSLRANREKLTLDKVLSQGDIYRKDLHYHLQNEDVGGAYIKKENEADFFNYLNDNIQKVIHSSSIPSEKKTRILYDNAESIVKKVYRERPTRSNIVMGKQLIGNFVTHLSVDKISVEVLLSLFAKDYYTFTHSVQVALLGMSFCKFLGWSESEVADFGLGALFHDIGKNSIDERILNKPGRLDKDEFELIKRHTLLGYQQLKGSQTMSTAQLAVPLHHHEASDGSGYPHGLKGYVIHKYARVGRIIDCYDALTTKRSYKDAFPSADALRVMKEEMGPTFDRDFLSRFITFMHMEEISGRISRERRANIELGNRILIQFDDKPVQLKGTLVGMESDEYLILRLAGLEQIHKQLFNGRRIIARYIQSGIICGFRTYVLGYVLHPLQLLFVSYPSSVENINLRETQRFECRFRVDVKIQDRIYTGSIKDISLSGCKLAVALPEENNIAANPTGQGVTVRMQLFSTEGGRLYKGEIRNMQRKEGDVSLGILFRNLSEEAYESLHRYIDNILASAG